jgi:hypothetical protein
MLIARLLLEWLEDDGGDGDGDETLAHIAEMHRRVSDWIERFGRTVQPGTVAVSSENFHLDGHIDFCPPGFRFAADYVRVLGEISSTTLVRVHRLSKSGSFSSALTIQ